ncbi:MAG: RNA-binding cell elongation regulator Jag/EloR [Dethiobacteria bacterium]
MKTLEVTAKTIEEALEEGIKELGVKKNNVRVEIINEPSQGLLKFLSSKNAKIKLTVLKEPEEYVKEILENILHIIKLNGKVIVERESEEELFFNISGKELGLLIGKRGSTLNALQYLMNVILHRQFALAESRVIIDIENYREKRKVTLEQLAKNLASKVMRTKKEVVLEPMTPQERRIIHIALKNNKNVVTYSYGDDPHRKVIISPR